MGSVYKRKGIWWIKYYRHGKPYYESSGSEKETKAKRLLKLREGEIAVGKFPGLRVEKITFNELTEDMINDYKMNGKKSLDRAELSLKHLKKFFDGYRAVNITTDLVNKYITKRQSEQAADATINRELSALKRMFSLGYRQTPQKVVNVPYIPKLQENNTRSGFFEHAEYLRLLEALPEYLRPLFTVAFLTGMRSGELRSLTWDQVNLAEGTIRLDPGTTKNKRGRMIFLREELYWTLAQQKEIRDREYPECQHVFSHRGKKIKDYSTAWERTLQKCGYRPKFKCNRCGTIFEYAIKCSNSKCGATLPDKTTTCGKCGAETARGKESKITDLTCQECGVGILKKYDKVFHDLRRSGVRNLVRSGNSEKVSMMISGHKTASVFRRYDITDETDLKIAAEKVAAFHRETLESLQKKNGYKKVTLGGKRSNEDDGGDAEKNRNPLKNWRESMRIELTFPDQSQETTDLKSGTGTSSVTSPL